MSPRVYSNQDCVFPLTADCLTGFLLSDTEHSRTYRKRTNLNRSSQYPEAGYSLQDQV